MRFHQVMVMNNHKAFIDNVNGICTIWKLLIHKNPLTFASCAVILSQSAFGADLPATKVTAISQSLTTWSGFYAGLNAGGAWTNSSSINVKNWPLPGSSWSMFNALASGNVRTSSQPSFIGGGQIGYNWLPNFKDLNMVLGLETDIQGNTSSGGNSSGINNYVPSAIILSTGPLRLPIDITTSVTGSQQLNYLGTLRGRLGYLIGPTLLAYGTGGLAYGGASTYVTSIQNSYGTIYSNSSPIASASIAAQGQGSNSTSLVGWTAGGGLEWMFLPN
jgi:outer membrane immunogenic protein